ncbi:hypothetical protein [Streptomyces sp. KHY 26]|uniref:hypothetical protein n=1 Tax=Streptomyces sp. KHY 26 TaxID=3097359 RepID=UPI00376EC6F5
MPSLLDRPLPTTTGDRRPDPQPEQIARPAAVSVSPPARWAHPAPARPCGVGRAGPAFAAGSVVACALLRDHGCARAALWRA